MSLVEIVHSYIKQPFPLWEYEVTKALVQDKWINLRNHNLLNLNDYSTARCINNTAALGMRYPISNNVENETVYLETYSLDYLKEFYDEHGLYPCSENEIESNAVLYKLKDAMTVFDLVQPTHSCITKLVRSIQVLKQDDEEIDVSYSHPKIPFSIFISVCHDNSILSNLRVAESIMHEAMHLKLTLIEDIVQLVMPDIGNLYYSPWRDEKRPARGVLHGLFVFRAVLNFYCDLEKILDSKIGINYINNRKEQIKFEFEGLRNFSLCPELTQAGAILSKNLLP